jgi:hypothetical protein
MRGREDSAACVEFCGCCGDCIRCYGDGERCWWCTPDPEDPGGCVFCCPEPDGD